MNEDVESYVHSLLKQNNEWVKEIEQLAKEDRVPIMEPVGISFLMQLIRLHQPKTILEIGTAIGYSALRMNEAYDEAQITTIERDEIRYNQAVDNIKKLKKEANIKTIFGDALETMDELICQQATFDFIFIDAAKGQYTNFFHKADELLNHGGVIVTDNVLFRGYVYKDVEIPKRYEKMVLKLRAYNEMIASLDGYDTIITPIGDGVAISIKK